MQLLQLLYSAYRCIELSLCKEVFGMDDNTMKSISLALVNSRSIGWYNWILLPSDSLICPDIETQSQWVEELLSLSDKVMDPQEMFTNLEDNGKSTIVLVVFEIQVLGYHYLHAYVDLNDIIHVCPVILLEFYFQCLLHKLILDIFHISNDIYTISFE